MQEPEASLEGLGGTYFFMNEAGKRSAIVKPCDEEPLAPCNPKVINGPSPYVLHMPVPAMCIGSEVAVLLHTGPCIEVGLQELTCNCTLQGFVGRSLGDPGLKPSVRVGEAAMREVAAFLLDHEHFASVPHTVMVKVRPCEAQTALCEFAESWTHCSQAEGCSWQ